MARTEVTPLPAVMEEHRLCGEKWCSHHKAFHSTSAFGPSKDRPDGLNPLCREAAREVDKRNHAKRRGDDFRGHWVAEAVKTAAPEGTTWCNIHARYCRTDTFGKDPRKANGLQSSCAEAQVTKKSKARNPPKRITSKYNPPPTGTTWCYWHKAFEPLTGFHKGARLCKVAQREKSRTYPEANAAKERNRRAKRKGNGGRHTAEEIIALGYRQDWLCANPLCHKDIKDEYDADHLIPINRRGSDYIFNIQLLCVPCNRKKSDKDPDDWADSLGFILK